MMPKVLGFLLRWAWIFLIVGLSIDAVSGQLVFFSLQGRGGTARIMFAIGGLVGDLPVIVVMGLIAAAILRLGFQHRITARLIAACLGIGCIVNVVLIHPILIYALR